MAGSINVCMCCMYVCVVCSGGINDVHSHTHWTVYSGQPVLDVHDGELDLVACWQQLMRFGPHQQLSLQAS